MDEADRFRGCLLGLATGDAVGTAVEFRPRGTFAPLTDMVGGGPFGLKPGEWTDDTSMALCLATSLVETGRFDPGDQARRYCRWWHEGYLSSNGFFFDIGITVGGALRKFESTGDPFGGSTHPSTAGNGCIMRLAPVPMFFFPDEKMIAKYSAESSRVTHGTVECLDACRLLGGILCRALGGADKRGILLGHEGDMIASKRLRQIALGDYRDKAEKEVRGTGYVVDSLEAALWCFWTTDSFETAILRAANLGDDADTTAAICGQVAGAFYGESGIPSAWLGKLALREDIRILADRLRRGVSPGSPA